MSAMENMIRLEVVCYNITSVLEAQRGGADRIELCDSPADGGTTPSAGMIKTAKEKCSIPIFVMIRPRGSDFLYEDAEFEVMKQDILIAKNLGADGIVLGILQADGTLDTKRCSELIKLAAPLPVSCHRAFDMTSDPFQALEDCIEAGFSRILTSGQQPTVARGTALIQALTKQAAGRIIIMPGAGINEENVAGIIKATGVSEIHASGKGFAPSKMSYRNPAVFMGDDAGEYQKLVTIAERIRKIKELATQAVRS